MAVKQPKSHAAKSRQEQSSDVQRWLTLRDAMARAQCGRKSLYRAIADGTLPAARLNDRGDFRFLPEWIDAWLKSKMQPVPQVGRSVEATRPRPPQQLPTSVPSRGPQHPPPAAPVPSWAR